MRRYRRSTGSPENTNSFIAECYSSSAAQRVDTIDAMITELGAVGLGAAHARDPVGC
jgi:hypothetical protein